MTGTLAHIRTKIAEHPASVSLREFFEMPPWSGYKLTPRRLLNLYLHRLEYRLGRTRVRTYPVKLTIEATNVCNLRCPACFTGVGETGRVRSLMSLELYRQLLEELGDYLFELEFYNWGEPLLSKHIYTMIEEAHRRGISTTVSTNFSLPFDAAKAERLVASGLQVLGVSIDGAQQETYEQYRVRGNLAKVLDNCRLINEAKRRLGSKTPRMIWEFHVFEHNVGDVERAKAMAKEMEMDIAIDKGWVVGAEWNPEGEWRFFGTPRPVRCPYLWGFAVINNDGGAASCCGSFYSEDDMGKIAVQPGEPGTVTSFREIWNGHRFQMARSFYRTRSNVAAAAEHICFNCPATVMYDDFKQHRARGGTRSTFRVAFSANDFFNYFWSRRPRAARGARIDTDPPARPAA